MGEHHRFEALRVFAAKRRSVKQKKLREAEMERDGIGSMNDKHLYIAGSGICASLAVHWATHKTAYTSDAKVARIYRKCAGTHFKYKVTGKIEDVFESNRAKADGEQGQEISRVAGPQAEIDELIMVWHSKAQAGTSAYVSFEITAQHGVVGGHGVAVHKNAEGVTSFFEPNAGIYDINKGDEAAFFSAYSDIVGQVYGGTQKLAVVPFR